MVKYLVSLIFILSICSDLTSGSLNLESTWNCQDNVDLNGEWDFYWEEFVDSSFPNSETKIDLPSYWHNLIIDDEKLGSFGYASYRRKIQIPKCQERVGLFIEHAHSAYRVYVNGELLHESGKVGKDKSSYKAYRCPAVILLPKGNYFDIIIHVSNYDHHRAGIVRTPQLVPYDNYEKELRSNQFIDTFIAGGSGIIGFTFLIIFFFSRRTGEVLFFGLMSITLGLRLLIAGIYPLHDVFDISNHFECMIRMEYVALFLLSAFGSLYISYLFPENEEKKCYSLIFIIGVFFALVGLFGPIHFFTAITPTYLLTLLFTICIICLTLIKQIRAGDRSAWFLGVGILFAIAWALMDTMEYFSIIESNKIIYSYLFLAFVFVNNLALMDRFAHELVLSNKRQALIDSAESRKLLMSMISHEIKTPVAQLQMNYEMLEISMSDPNKIDYLKHRIIPRFKKSIDSIKIMLNDFVYFMNINSHSTEISTKSAIKNILGESFSIKIIDLLKQEFSFETNQKVLIYAISTFVSNAIKYTPQNKPQPEIKILRFNELYCIEIKDYGVGMNEAVLSKMGDLQMDTTDIMEVHGVGFYLAKKLLEMIGHKVYIESNAGIGTSVKISL